MNAWYEYWLAAIILATVPLSPVWAAEVTDRAEPPVVTPAVNEDWSRVAARDIDAARDFISEAHPGVLERDDVMFHAWFRQGYQDARAWADRAQSREQAEAAVRYFLVGFQDAHLRMTSSQMSPGLSQWAGFNVQWQDGGYRVVHRSDDPTETLPPMGARMISCDGKQVDTLLRERVAPFIDRRMHLDATRSALAIRLTNKWWDSQLWQPLGVSACTVETSGGVLQTFPLRWRASDDGLGRLMHEQPEQRIRPWRQKASWIHVSNFMPVGSQIEAFDDLLKRVGQSVGKDWLVLDTRGNLGGNSVFGMQLLDALLKEQMPTIEPAPRAYWRVSPVAIQALQSHLGTLSESPTSKATRELVVSLLRQMQDGFKARAPWILQDDLDWSHLRKTSGPAFRGRIVLVTDAQCTSACLDFVDVVLRVPGVIHVGAPTSADTRYLDATNVRLPSGLTMMLPLKVWRGRARGDNEPRVPAFVFSGDLWNTPAFEQWLWDEVLPSVKAGDRT